MNDKIITQLPQSINCFETCNKPEFGVFDPSTEEDEASKLVLSDGEIHFKVLNLNEKEITFLKVDKCVFNNTDREKCDFVLFDDIDFCFCEIKTYQRPKNRKKRREKAYNQVLSTIEYFKDIDLCSMNIEAYIVLNKQNQPFSQQRPKASAGGFAQKRKAIELLKRNIIFFEGNSKSF